MPDELQRFATSIEALAGMTSISGRQWREYCKRPGFPAKTERGYDVAACLAWKRDNVRARAEAGELGPLKEQKLEQEVRYLRLKGDREERRMIPRSEVDALLLHIATRQKTLLYQRLETELPPKLDGLSAAETRPILRKVADDICDEMRDLTAQFEAQ